MSICCNEVSCIYHRMGECVLDRALSAGTRQEGDCVYFVKKRENK